MQTCITDLPPELVFRILEYVPGCDIGQLSQTCTWFRDLCCADIIWQKLCQKGWKVNSAEDWGVSFYDIYTKVLHRYGRCIGLWRRHMPPYGGLLQVKIDKGKLIGTEYHPPVVSNIHGPLRPRTVFSVGINKSTKKAEIMCLRGYHGPQPGCIEFDKEKVDVVFKCSKMSSHVHPDGSASEFGQLMKEETNNNSVPFTSYDKSRLECYLSNAHSYLLSSIKIQPADPGYPIQPGLFSAHYSAHGIEMFLLKYDMEKKEAQVVKITGDPNVPSGETSIFVNLRKPMELNKDQQCNINYITELTEDKIPDVEEIQLCKQPFVVPPNFQTFFGDFDATTCDYRFLSQGRVAGTGYKNRSFSPGHLSVISEDIIYNIWLLMYCVFGYYRIKDFN